VSLRPQHVVSLPLQGVVSLPLHGVVSLPCVRIGYLIYPARRQPAGAGEDPQVVAAGSARMETGVLQHGTDCLAWAGQLVVAQPTDQRLPSRGAHQPQ
jgi:hypothetical protein